MSDLTSDRVFEWLGEDVADARLRAVAKLKLDGRDVDVKVASALRDVRIDRTITGASTVTIDLLDPDGDLLDSPVFGHQVQVELVLDDRTQKRNAGPGITVPSDDPLRFMLERIAWPARVLTGTFTDREVALLKRYDEPRRANRDQVTRAEFVRMLVREVREERISFWSPELHKVQPVRHSRDLTKKARADTEHDRGLHSSDRVKVKGVKASAAQLRVLNAALAAVSSLKGASKPVLVMTVMCLTQETTAQNLGPRVVQGPRGPQTITGAFQQTIGGGWPASRDVAKDAVGFGRRLIDTYQRYTGTGKSFGDLIDLVQGAGTPKAYDKWHDEATITVNEWSGGSGFTSSEAPRTKYVRRFEFRRGEPGGGRETSWDAMQRLAQEVQWRCFVDRGVVYFVSDDYLRQGKVRLRIVRGELPPAITEVRVLDFDSNRRAAAVELDAIIGSWVPPLGGMVELDGYGKASGRYLIERTSGSLLAPKWTVSLTRAVEPLKEPPVEQVMEQGGGNVLLGGIRVNIPATATGQLGRFLQWARSTLGTHEGSGLQRRWAQDLGAPTSWPWCSIWIAYGMKHFTTLAIPTNAAYSGAWLTWSGGRRVNPSQAAVGDFLVFDWGDGGITDHVGVYLGRQKYISGNLSDVVQISAVKWGNVVGCVRPDW